MRSRSSRSIPQRNAASVLPEPVGARIRVWSPAAIAGQPRSWAGVGSAKARANHSATTGWKSSSAGRAAGAVVTRRW